VCKGYADIRGGSLDMGHQMIVGSSKIAIYASCGRYIFQKFINTKIIMSEYVVPQWLFIDIETDDLDDIEWPFCVKYCFPFQEESFSNDAPVLSSDCFKIDGDAYIPSAAKM